MKLVDSVCGLCLDWQGRMPLKETEAVREVELKAKAKEGAGILGIFLQNSGDIPDIDITA